MKTAFNPLVAFTTAALIFGAASSWGEEFYRWRDAKGIAHYGSTPPQGIKATKVKVYGTRSPSPIQRTAQAAGSEQQKLAANSASTAPQKQAQLKKAQASECQAERKRLRVLKSNQPIRMKQANGELKYLTRQEIAQEIQESKSFLNDACS